MRHKERAVKEEAGPLADLSLKQRAALCSGRDFWHLKPVPALAIPPLLLTDGPHGVRKQVASGESVAFRSVPATCFPTASATACSWDRVLLRAIGTALGEECLAEGVSVLLGPGINIKRSPLCGRNFEYFSEDPVLAGELGAAWIEGLQGRGVGASLKHFAVNNQERHRATIDVRVDPRTLREIYLTGFERAIRQARPWTVMCAYNRVNGAFCSEHRELLTDILRDEWGFEGVLLTDWGACNDRVAGLEAGQDLEMPGSAGLNDARILRALRSDALDETILDRSAERILALMRRASANRHEGYQCDREAHHALARRAAAESAVLARNEDGLLPLAAGASLAVLGRFADEPRYQGAGSSQIEPWRLETAWQEFQRRCPGASYAPGYTENGEAPDEALLAEACALAEQADVAVVFAGLPAVYESEAFDREHMALPAGHTALIEGVAKANPRTVVVLACGAPVELPWADRVAAILVGYLGGQAGGPALVDVLTGQINPSGRFAETWPLTGEQTPAQAHFPGGPEVVEYREALYVGYRYYDAVGEAVPVRFPFGHGLGYTRFKYAPISLSARHISDRDTLRVDVAVTNVGEHPGAEVVQLYVRDVDSTVFRPPKELKGFDKAWLAPGETRHLRFQLEARDFAFYNTAAESWQVESGEFEILVGASSRDIRDRASVEVSAAVPAVPSPDLRHSAPIYYNPPRHSEEFDRASFQALCPNLPQRTTEPGDFHLNSTLGELKHHPIGRRLYQTVLRGTTTAVGEDQAVLREMMRRMVEEMPLRQVVLFSDGRLTYELADVLLALMNRHYSRALRNALGLFRRSERPNTA